MFDNSWRSGNSFEFPLGAGRVIQGWDEGIALLQEGDKATFFIPYELRIWRSRKSSYYPW